MELINDGGFTDAGVAGNKNELRPADGYYAIECSEQGVDFGFSPVQFLWNQQPVWHVLLAKREFDNAMLRFPFSKTTPKITLDSNRGLIALLGRLGEQLHDDCRNRARHTRVPLAGCRRLPCDMAVHQFHRIGCHKWERPGQHLVKRYAKSIEVAPGI